MVLLKELAGLTYYGLRMWNNAIAYFEAVNETHLFCSDAMLHFCLGVAFGRTKNLKAEEKQYRLALESNPDYPPTLRNMGYCLYRQKKLLAAKEVLEHCLAVSEEDSLAAEYYLKVLVSLKRNKDAKQFLKKGYKVSGSIRKRVEGLDYSNARLRKRDSGYDDAYQQIVDYLNWFENHFTDSKKNIYGIICLNSPSQELVKKVRGDKRIRLFEYRISYAEI